MALEAIAAVEEAEAAAIRRKTEAAQQARRLAVLAQGEGEQMLEETKKKISAQLQLLETDAEARICTERDRVRGETESELSILRARAESRLDQAAEKIMELAEDPDRLAEMGRNALTISHPHATEEIYRQIRELVGS